MKRMISKFVRWYRVYRFKKQCPRIRCNYNELISNHVIDKGSGNSIIIDKGSSISCCKIEFYGSNCLLHIGCNVHLRNISFWFEDNGSKIVIGSGTSMETRCKFAACEGKHIFVGEDCMLSHDIDVRNTDSHSLLDEKGNRINPAADIIIGNHVWIGIRSTILKGGIIPNNSVVAAQSMITSSLRADEHSLIAGIPAKVVRSNISWDRKRF